MPRPDRTHLSDLRGATRMAFDATEGVAEIVEKMHRTVQLLPGPLGRAASDRTRGITGLVYRIVRGSIRLIGRGVDASLAPVAGLLPEGESSPARDAFRSAVNGLYGDYLHRTGNPLAIDMSLRHHGRPIDLENPANLFSRHSDTTQSDRLLVLVHGLCMNDHQWEREGHNHGEELAEEFGYVPLFLRYNSGLKIASNGLALAEMLETLVGNLTSPVNEIAIIGFSMGGLVARSACHHGREAGHTWTRRLRKLVFLGAPHHGVPLERGGYGLDYVMDLSPYSAPFTRIGRTRSAGITDLRHGAVTMETRESVPLPSGVQCYAAAAMHAERSDTLSRRLIGDGLVPLDSALGRHRDESQALNIPEERQLISYGTGHLELLNRPELYEQLRVWLQESD